MIEQDEQIEAMLQEFVNAYGPVGQEDEVREKSLRELKTCCDTTWIDEAGNAVGLIRGSDTRDRAEAGAVRLLAHMDELALVVKRITDEGTLHVAPLGGLRPSFIGQGPVEILSDSGALPGILSVGSVHVTSETPNVAAARHRPLQWQDTYIFTRLSREELEDAGVGPGARVVIARHRRGLYRVHDTVAGHFLDNRASIVAVLRTGQLLTQSQARPPRDTYIVMTTAEEVDNAGATYASRTLPGATDIAVDVAPVAEEYRTRLDHEPVIVYGHGSAVYSKPICDDLLNLARQDGMNPQRAFLEDYASDASASSMYGQTGHAALVGIPTENTHGFEVIALDAVRQCSNLLAKYCQNPHRAA